MLKIHRVNVGRNKKFIEHAFQPCTPNLFFRPPHMALRKKFEAENTYVEGRCLKNAKSSIHLSLILNLRNSGFNIKEIINLLFLLRALT